jgi:DNA-binding SARP family transcriptional activator
VSAFHRGRDLALGGPRARSVLAVLLLNAGLTVPKDRLIASAWADDPPPTADELVAAYVSRLRKALLVAGNSLRLRSVRPGFRAEVDSSAVLVDVIEFNELMQRAGRERDSFEHELSISTLRRALELWGGYTEALVDLDAPWLRRQAAALGDRRLDALEQLGALHLAAGRAAEAAELLGDVVRQHPEHERMAVTLVDALASSGRQAQAAQAAALAATALVRLGQRPGPELRRAQTEALAERNPEAPARRTGQRFQLPADTGAFTGRRDEIAQLIEFAGNDEDDRASGRVLIAAIDGMGGIGKSALAVHLAHRLADRYPDGQLFADLHAYTPGHRPREAHEILETFLRALGAAPDEIPADQDARSAMLRGRLAGTRTLILLDNARDEAQIRPLLPGDDGCLVLVTSRRRLKGIDEAMSLSLALLPDADAAALFRAVAGSGRVEPSSPALVDVVELCARLPLALRIAAAILRHRPTWSVERLAARLRDRSDRVEALSDGERDLSVIFDLSYKALPADARTLYRRLGVHPGLDLDVSAAAALAQSDPVDVVTLLEILVDHNLLDEPAPGRYRTHDLIRIHAHSRADADESAELSAAAEHAVLDYYLGTARAADRYLARRTLPVETTVSPPVHGPVFATREEAADWVRSEFANLAACVDFAVEHDQAEFVVAMSAALHGYLYTHGPWSYALELHTRAVEAATSIGDAPGRAAALHCMGRVRRQTGDFQGAVTALHDASHLYNALGIVHGQAHTRDALGRIGWLTGEYPRALADFEQALPLYRSAGDPLGEAGALNGMGRVRRLTGDAPEAVRLHRQALALCRDAGDPISEATALTDLAGGLADVGDRNGALDALEESLSLYRATGHVLGEANALYEVGRIERRDGSDQDAEVCLEGALELYGLLGHVWGQAGVMVELARIRLSGGDASGALQASVRALTHSRQVGDRRGESSALNGTAAALVVSGEIDQARAAYEDALTIARAIGSPSDEAEALEGLAALADSAVARAQVPRATDIGHEYGLIDS